MYDLILTIILVILIFFTNQAKYWILAILGIELIYKIFTQKINISLKRKTKSKLKEDLQLVNEKSKMKNFRFYKNLLFVLCLITGVSWGIFSDKIATRYFNYRLIHFILLSVAVLFITFFLYDSPVATYLTNLQQSKIEESYDAVFYDKIKNLNISRTDDYNKNLLLTYLENTKNKLLFYLPLEEKVRSFGIQVTFNICALIYFSSFDLILTLFTTYILFYRVIYLKNQKDITQTTKNYTNAMKEKNDKLNYIFSDFRSMIFYEEIKRDNNFDTFIYNNNKNISKRKKEIGARIAGFNYKFNLFKRLVYCFAILYQFLRFHKGMSTVAITTSILVINYVFINNAEIFYLLVAYNEAKFIENEYNNINLESIKNEKYRKFIELTSKKVEFKNNYFFIEGNKIDKKMTYLNGESGKGKTTILKCLLYYNLDILNKIAFLSQELDLDINNIIIDDVICGFEKTKDIEIIKKAMKIACLDKRFKIGDNINNISGGEKQRCKIARIIYYSLISKCEYLIMDEPDNNLDYLTFKNIMMNILEIEHISNIIFTSHKKNIIKDFPKELLLDIKL